MTRTATREITRRWTKQTVTILLIIGFILLVGLVCAGVFTMLKPWKVKPAAEDMGLHEGEGTTTNAVGKMVILPSSIANPLRYGITGTAPSLLTATQASLAAYYASSHTPHPVSTLTGRYVAPARAINADLYNKGGFKLPTKIPVPPPVPSTRPGSGPVVVTGTGSGGITRLSLGLCLSGLCLQVALGLL